MSKLQMLFFLKQEEPKGRIEIWNWYRECLKTSRSLNEAVCSRLQSADIQHTCQSSTHSLKAGDLEAKYYLKIFTKIWQAAGKRSHISSHSPHQGLGAES